MSDRDPNETDPLGHHDTVASSGTGGGRSLPALDLSRYRRAGGAEALLGRGGQGVVWRGVDSVLRREIALKALRSDQAQDAGAVDAFLREARLTAALEHQGIVPLHDVGIGADGAPTLVLRRIQGSSLADKLDRARSLDERLRLVPAVLRAAQAVAFAHQRHVIHRDLKPQNVMLGEFGETYVLDWGLALVTHAGPGAPDVTVPTEQRGPVGTPAYMSPEQAMGLGADTRSDVWGLGACLYHLLTSQPPVRGRSLESALSHAAVGDVVPVRELAPTAPVDLAAICEKALAAKPVERYASALEFAADLDAWLAGRTVSAREYTPLELGRRAFEANRLPVLAVAAALLALITGLGVDEFRVRRERNEARLFARELVRDLSSDVDTVRANISLVATMTERVMRWLERSDLSPDESAEACLTLVQLASFNLDTGRLDVAQKLSTEALRRAREGQRGNPDVANFVACEGDALHFLGFSTWEAGDQDGGVASFQRAEAALDSWKGTPTPMQSLVRASLDNTWGSYLWATDQEQALTRTTRGARLSATLLDDESRFVREVALNYGGNGSLSIWFREGRPAARALTDVFAKAAERGACDHAASRSLHACVSALATDAVLRSWDDEADTPARIERAVAKEKELLARDTDSMSTYYDAMVFALERGEFAQAHEYATVLRTKGPNDWAATLGPFIGALAGELDALDAYDPAVGGGPALLGFALRDVSRGQYREAAKRVRAAKRPSLWFDLSWCPHPKPALQVPAAARPAYERFLSEFTVAYGIASPQGLDTTLDHFADALDALAP